MSTCFFDAYWQTLAHNYTRCANLEGIFCAPKTLMCIGDIHGDFQLLYTLLVDVLRVVKPRHISSCSCAFKPQMDPLSRSPDKLLHLTDCLPSCTFEWSAHPSTWICFLGDYCDRKRTDTLKFSKIDISSSCTSEFDGEMKNEECAILDFINYCSVLSLESKTGCRIIKILGNHELTNLDNVEVDPEYITSQALTDTSQGLGFEWGTSGRKKAFGYEGPLRQKLMLLGCYGIVQIGRALLMHGGLNSQFTHHPAFKSVFEKLDIIQDLNEQNDSLLEHTITHSTIPQINAALYHWLNMENSNDNNLNDIDDSNDSDNSNSCNVENNSDSIFGKEITPVLFHDACCPFWDRGLSQDDLPIPSLKIFAEALHQTIRSNIDVTRSIVVVGHCIQTGRYNDLNSKPSYKFICRINEDQELIHRLGKNAWFCDSSMIQNIRVNNVLDISESNRVNGSNDSVHSLLTIPFCGIQFQAPQESYKSEYLSQGQIYMCDAAMSRAFDLEFEMRHTLQENRSYNFECRAPQALVLHCNQNWRPEIWISKYHLSRRWLKDNEVILL